MWTPTIALLPGALTIYLGFDGGGYFPPATGVACGVLAIALVLRLTLAPRPLEGFGLAAGLVAAAIALFGVWSLISSSWSDAPARAVAEFDRALLYLLMFALVATLPRTTQTARIGPDRASPPARRSSASAGLLTRVLPDVFPIAPNVLDQRLSYPITYWNGVGLLAALAIVFATHFTCSTREHPAARVTAAAVLPLLASTLFFTFSRASIVVMVVGVVALRGARAAARLPAGADRGAPGHRDRRRRVLRRGRCSPGRIRPRMRRSTRATRSSSCWSLLRARGGRRALRADPSRPRPSGSR